MQACNVQIELAVSGELVFGACERVDHRRRQRPTMPRQHCAYARMRTWLRGCVRRCAHSRRYACEHMARARITIDEVCEGLALMEEKRLLHLDRKLHLCACVRACMRVCMRACMHACMLRACVRACVRACMLAFRDAHVHACVRECACACACACMLACARVPAPRTTAAGSRAWESRSRPPAAG